MNFKETECDTVELIRLATDRRLILVKTLMNLRAAYKASNFLRG